MRLRQVQEKPIMIVIVTDNNTTIIDFSSTQAQKFRDVHQLYPADGNKKHPPQKGCKAASAPPNTKERKPH